MNNKTFEPVSYRQFRRATNSLHGQIKNKGFATYIYDDSRNLQAIVQAASIDESGHCLPAQYFISDQIFDAVAA